MTPKHKHSPSINIVRDFSSSLDYTPTPNSERIAEAIAKSFVSGTRSFSIIGSYGTGKSAFLVALEQQLSGRKQHFSNLNGAFGSISSFHFLNVVGEYDSLRKAVAKSSGLRSGDSSGNEIISQLKKKYLRPSKEKQCLVIVLDEFGKFLEHAAANNPADELYFVQQLAEFANDNEHNVIFISVLHQSFTAYSAGLTHKDRHEWEKVRGRLKEITFNEPVEQLLHLGAKYLSRNNGKAADEKNQQTLVRTIKKARVFPLRTKLTLELARQLYPLDILAAGVLTTALQIYGQNERSLFSFLNSEDYCQNGVIQSDSPRYYGLCEVYDYLLSNYSSILLTKYNPHFFQWRALQNALYRVEAEFDTDQLIGINLVKVIGLLNIFAASGARIDEDFLVAYFKTTLGYEDFIEVLQRLETKKIIRYLHYKDQYILFEGTDLDIELEVQGAEDHVDYPQDLIRPLINAFDFPYLPARRTHFETGIPRYFKFRITDEPYSLAPNDEIDGIINLIISFETKLESLLKFSEEQEEAIIYGLFNNTQKISEILFEIDKIKYVLDKSVEDHVAQRELQNMLQFQQGELNREIMANLYSGSSTITWVYGGKQYDVSSHSKFNRLLSEICDKVYFSAPIYKNELINRAKLSSAVVKARNNFYRHLVDHLHEENLGFSEAEFPPEKTIYLSLLKKTGIHHGQENTELQKPIEMTFAPLWNASENFLKSAVHTKKPISDLFEILLTRPFKLKQGFVEFWVPLFLFIRREDFALYSPEGFIPDLNGETMELVVKYPQRFQLKSFELKGVKLDLFNRYRNFVSQKDQQSLSTSGFVETIKPFLSFYRSLPDYAKTTHRLSTETLKVREVIVNAIDPETVFFEGFPTALGYQSLEALNSSKALENFVIQLQGSIRELRTCFEALLNRIEGHLCEISGFSSCDFPDYQQKFQERYRSIKTHLLLPHQKVVYKQLMSQLDERFGWLRALIQSVIGKPVEKIMDNEEEIVFDKLSTIIWELDNLCKVTAVNSDEKHDEIIKIDLASIKSGTFSQTVVITDSQQAKAQKQSRSIRKTLSENRQRNIASLLQLLKEELGNGES